MKISNILKVADIEIAEFDQQFLSWLEKEIEPDYRDLSLDIPEHVYNIDSIREQLCGIENVSAVVDQQLDEIDSALKGSGTRYFRIIFY